MAQPTTPQDGPGSPTRQPALAPYLVARDARGLLEFLETGLGGRRTYEEEDANGRIAHAEVRIEDSLVMIAEMPEGRSSFPAMLHLYVADADASYARALSAGATSVRPPTDQPDGDRRGGVRDRWGNEWWFTRSRSD
jgi:PhnB protein